MKIKKKVVAEVVNQPGKIKLLCSSFLGNNIVFVLIDGRRIVGRINELKIKMIDAKNYSYEEWHFSGVGQNSEFSGRYESHRKKMFLYFNL